MQVVKKILGALFIFMVAVIVWMPRTELYFKLEHILSQKGVYLNEKSISDGLVSLEIQESQVYFEGISLATIQQSQLITLLLWNRLEIDGVVVDDGFSDRLPKEVKHISLVYSLLAPQKIAIEAVGTFGRLEGSILLDERKIYLELVEVAEIKKIKPYLKKGKKGWYYEISF